MTPPFKTFPLGLRLVMVFGLFLINWTMVSYLALYLLHSFFGVDDLTDIDGMVNPGIRQINGVLALQAFSTIGGFMLTAMMFSVLESGEFIRYLGLKYSSPLRMVLLAVFSMIVAQFFISWLVDLNNKIPLPDFLKPLKDAQKKIDDMEAAFFNFKSFGQFLVVSFVLAVIPAIAEEMFFRGLLLGDMLKAKVKPATAIIITGLIFALVHFEFQNTLSIWVLGCFLGYLYYVSGSLWLSIIAHFVNNFLDVLLKYLYNIGVFKTDISNSSIPVYLVALSFLILALCIFFFNKWKVQPSFVEEDFHYEETIE